MENCLVQTLMGVVNNDNLSYFNSIVMKCKKKSGFDYINAGLTMQGVQYSGTVEILSGNGYLSGEGHPNYGTKHEYANENYVLIMPDTADAEVVIKVSPKSSITTIYGSEGIIELKNIKDLDYCINLAHIGASTEWFKTKDFVGLHLPSLIGLSGVFVGDINNLAAFNLTYLYLDDTGTLTGDIVSYFEQRRNVTPSGSMEGRFGYNATFNGTHLPFINITYIWDATSIIAKPNIGDSTTAWTYGATAEQISALENEGYTVVQVD